MNKKYQRCNRAEADEWRCRFTGCSVGLEGKWSEWLSVEYDNPTDHMGFQYEFRKRNEPEQEQKAVDYNCECKCCKRWRVAFKEIMKERDMMSATLLELFSWCPYCNCDLGECTCGRCE